MQIDAFEFFIFKRFLLLSRHRQRSYLPLLGIKLSKISASRLERSEKTLN